MTTNHFINQLGVATDFTSRQSLFDSLSILSRQSVLAILVVCLTVLGAGKAWGAETVTWTISGVATGANGAVVNTALNTSAKSPSSETGVWTAVSSANSYAGTSSGAQLGSKNYSFNGTITLSGSTAITNSVKITGISITCKSGGSYTIQPKVGGSNFASSQTINTTTATPKNFTNASGMSGTVVIQLSTSATKYFNVSSISVTYEEVCNGTKLDVPNVTTVPASGQVQLSWPAVANATKYQVSWNGGAFADATSPFTKTSLSNGTSYTWKVKAIGNGSTYCNSEINEGSTKAGSPYTITWKVNGETYATTYVANGDHLVLPTSPSPCIDGKIFAGWSASTIDGTTNTKPTFVSSQTTINAAQTYHAVFATPTSNSYTKGDINDLFPGQTVLIVNISNNVAVSKQEVSGQSDKRLQATGVTISTNTISSMSNSNLIWTVENRGQKYNFKIGSSYLRATGTGNDKLSYSSGADAWTLTASSGKYYMNSTNSTTSRLEFYSSYFTTYGTNSTGTGYEMYFFVPTCSGYFTSCCTSLASINGSVSWSNGQATVSWDAAGGCGSWGLKYKRHADSDIPANWTSYAGSFGTATGRTSNSTAISSLTAGTEYDFKITGTSDGSVYCSGTVTETKSSTVPKIIATSSMTDLGYQEGETPDAQTFTITGTQLTGNLTVTAPSNFLVSLDGSSWSAAGGSKTITVSTPPNNLGSTTIHVKANSGLLEGADPSGNIAISGGGAASVNVAVSATITEACTAPSSVTITGTTKYFGGQTISLTATPTGGVGEASYQWQKKVSGVWTNVANGGGISGATTNNLQITSCTHGNSGGYRCVVSTGTTCSTKSHADDNAGYGVHVYSIYGRYYNEGEWAHNEIAYTSGTTGTATVHLSAKKTYTFKVRSNNDLYYGNSSGNFIIQPATNMDCGTNNSEIRLFTTIEGDYTITVDIAHGLDNSPYVTIAVSYPSVTHPSTGYVYVQKFSWRPYLHYWYDNSNKLTEWGSDPQLNSDQYTTICGTEYWCVPVIDYYCNFIAKDAAGDPSNTTGDQYTNSPHPGQKLYNDGSWKWAAIPTYTISYAGGTGSTGSMSSESSIIAGSDQTLTAFNTITKAGYTFSCWHANQDVTIGGSTVNEGDDISDGATIQNVCGNITLTAQWTANTNTAYTVKHYQQNIANDDYTEVTGDRQNLTGTTDASVTPAVKSYTGFTAPSTQTVTILGDGSCVVDYYYTRNSYNLTWNLGGGTTTTAGTGIASGVSVNTTSSIKFGTSLTAPTVTKTGYGFSAWSPAKAATMPAEATSYTATWSATNYTITYNLNSGTNPGGAPTGFTIESSEITLPTPTRAGYRFDGWYANVGLTGDVQTTIPAGSTGNKTYWAKWTAKTDTYKTALHTDASGWDAYASGYTTNTSGAGYSIPAGAGNVSKGATSSCSDLHYVFAGWVADEYKASPDGHIISASGTTDATGTTYWAVWGDAVATDTYTRLTSIGDIDESAEYVLGIDGTGFHYSGTSSWGLTALPANQTPFYYTLTKEDAATPTYFTAETSVSSTTYYLQVAGTGAFNMTTSSGTTAGQLVIGSTTNYGGSDKAYAVSVNGSTDKSLRRNGASGIRCYNNTTTGSLVFFYKVVPAGDIDYVTSCCELKPATSVTVASTTGTSVTLSWAAPSPTTGITKLQVRDASDDAVLVDNLDEDATGATVSELTECDEYTFYIASVGATCYTASESVDAQPYSGAKTITYKYHDDVTADGTFTTDCDHTSTNLPNPSRTGYTLNGWYTAAEGGTKKGDGGASYTPDATITLHAQWTEKPKYTITLNAGNGTISDANWTNTSGSTYTRTQSNGDEAITLPTPSCNCSGWVFQGWSTTSKDNAASFTPDKEDGASFTPASDVTYYAVYRQNATGGTTYNKITSTGDLTTGNYIFMSSGGYAMKNVVTSSRMDEVGGYTASNSSQTIDNANLVWTIAKFSSQVVIKNGANYLGIDADNNICLTTTPHFFTYTYNAGSSRWEFTSVTKTSYQLTYSTAAGTSYSYFCAGTSQSTAIYLYKQGDGLTGNYKTNPSCSDITVTGAVSPAGSGTVTLTTGSGKSGDKVYAMYTPDEDYNFNNWSIEGTGSSLGSTSAVVTEITIGSENTTVTANFVAKDWKTVTWKADGVALTGDGLGSAPVKVENGFDITALPPAPAPCDDASTTFMGWVEDGDVWSGKTDDVSGVTIYTKASDFPTVTANVTYHAVWAKRNGTAAPATYAGTGVFTKITTMEELEVGAHYVLYGEKVADNTVNAAMNNTFSNPASGKYVFGGSSVTISDGKITNPATTIVWKLGGTTNAYTLYSQNSSKYVEITANDARAFSNPSSPTTSFTIDVNEGSFRIMSNHASASSRMISLYTSTEFRSYANNNTDYVLNLYKYGNDYTYDKYLVKCCEDPELAFAGEYNYQTLVRQDIHGARGGNGSATVEQGKATLVLDYVTESDGTCTVEVKKLTGGDNRSTAVAGSDCSNHTNIAINESTKKVTFDIWTYAGSYPTANGQGTYRIKITQAATSTYCEAVTYYFVDVTLRDKFVDAVNGNTTINVDGQSKTTSDKCKTPTEASLDADKNDDCHSTTRRFLGWVREDNMDTWYVTGSSTRVSNLDDKKEDAAIVAPNADIITSGSTWYAVWGEEVTE